MNLRNDKKDRKKVEHAAFMARVAARTEERALQAKVEGKEEPTDSALDVDVNAPKDGLTPYAREQKARREQIDSTAASIASLLDGLNPKVTDTKLVLAKVFESLGSGEAMNNHLEWTVDTFMGQAVHRMIPDMLKLCDWVHEQGYTEKNQWDLGYADRYAFSLANEPDLKVLVGIRQSDSYLLLMEDFYGTGNWDVHLRHMPTHRPNLKELKKTDFITNDEQSHPKFRYLDTRDEGYLASMEPTGTLTGSPSVKNVMPTYYQLGHVLHDLKSFFYHVDKEIEKGDAHEQQANT